MDKLFSSVCLCCYMAHGMHVKVYLEKENETTLLHTEDEME